MDLRKGRRQSHASKCGYERSTERKGAIRTTKRTEVCSLGNNDDNRPPYECPIRMNSGIFVSWCVYCYRKRIESIVREMDAIYSSNECVSGLLNVNTSKPISANYAISGESELTGYLRPLSIITVVFGLEWEKQP